MPKFRKTFNRSGAIPLMATEHEPGSLLALLNVFQSLRRDTPHGNDDRVILYSGCHAAFNRSGAIPLMATGDTVGTADGFDIFQSLRRDTPHGNGGYFLGVLRHCQWQLWVRVLLCEVYR